MVLNTQHKSNQHVFVISRKYRYLHLWSSQHVKCNHKVFVLEFFPPLGKNYTLSLLSFLKLIFCFVVFVFYHHNSSFCHAPPLSFSLCSHCSYLIPTTPFLPLSFDLPVPIKGQRSAPPTHLLTFSLHVYSVFFSSVVSMFWIII